jgi:predicted nucleic acid-binding protein
VKILLDTNVVLDLLLEREPFFLRAREVFALIESREIKGMLCATTVTTLHYLLGKSLDTRRADKAVQTLLELFEIAPVDGAVLREASTMQGADFEDDVIVASARRSEAVHIITRDRQGFADSEVPASSPEEFLAFYGMV